MTLSAKLLASVTAEQSSDLDLGERSFPVALRKLIELAHGTGADQADLMFTDTRTLAASGTENLDLAGVLVDAFGTTMTFARLKGILVAAAGGNTHNVNVTQPATNGVPLFLAAGDGMPVHPKGLLFWVSPGATGVVVTPGTGDLITITNAGAVSAVTYDVVLIGASA